MTKYVEIFGILMPEIIYPKPFREYCPDFRRTFKMCIRDGVYIKHTLPPLYSEKDLIISDNTFGIPIPKEMPIEVYVLADREDKLLRILKRKNPKTKNYGRCDTYIYALVDKNNMPFYIGSTKNDLMKRFRSHIEHSYKYPEKHSVMKSNKPIRIEILCMCPELWQFREEWNWINSAKNAKIKLTNIR